MSKNQVLDRLTNLGLLIHSYSDLSPYPGGYLVAKPKSIKGNTRKNEEAYFGDDDILCDAPPVYLYPHDDVWIVKVSECVPGPGPGDFQISFESLNDATSSIIDYFFGEPYRMNPPELLNLENSIANNSTD